MAIFLEIRYSCYNKLYNDEEPINLADSDAHGNDQKNIKEMTILLDKISIYGIS